MNGAPGGAVGHASNSGPQRRSWCPGRESRPMLAPPGVEPTRREAGQGPYVVHPRSSTTAVASKYMGAPRANVSLAPACPVGPQPSVHAAL